MSTRTLPPGPRARPFFGLLPEFRKDPLALLDRMFQDYGDLVTVPLGPYPFLLVSDPALIEEVLVTQNRLFIKGRGLENSRRVLGNGLVSSEGEFWRRQRRLAQPAFHRTRVQAYGETMVDFALQHIASWRHGAIYDINREMMRLTLAIAAKTLFSADVSHEADVVGAALEVTLREFQRRMRTMIKIPETWPTPNNIRYSRAVEALDRVIYRIIDDRRQSGEDTGDLLSMLLHAVDEDGSQMTPQQLRDETMTLFLAGHETTANAMTWTWYLLGLNPEAEARLHAELEQVLGGRPPGPQDLPSLPYVEAVISESMRLYPPVWILGRRSTAPVEVGSYSFGANQDFLMSQWVMHRNPRYFENPLHFQPERWLDGLAKRLPRFAYFPFGGGPRICIGAGFALMEAQLLLATIAQQFRLQVDPTHQVGTSPSMTLRPAGPVSVVALTR